MQELRDRWEKKQAEEIIERVLGLDRKTRLELELAEERKLKLYYESEIQKIKETKIKSELDETK